MHLFLRLIAHSLLAKQNSRLVSLNVAGSGVARMQRLEVRQS